MYHAGSPAELTSHDHNLYAYRAGVSEQQAVTTSKAPRWGWMRFTSSSNNPGLLQILCRHLLFNWCCWIRKFYSVSFLVWYLLACQLSQSCWQLVNSGRNTRHSLEDPAGKDQKNLIFERLQASLTVDIYQWNDEYIVSLQVVQMQGPLWASGLWNPRSTDLLQLTYEHSRE